MSGPRRPGDEVPSPCISVCAIVPGTSLCAGCFRTLDEIALWSVLDAHDKREVLAALPARRAVHLAAGHAPHPDTHDPR